MRWQAPIKLWRTLVVYVLGLVAGIQCALYLFDRYDDGVAEPLSAGIGGVMVAIGIVVAVWPYRGPWAS